MNVLIIWEGVEGLNTSIIRDPSKSELEMLKSCNGKSPVLDDTTDNLDLLYARLNSDWKNLEVSFPIQEHLDLVICASTSLFSFA